MRRRSISTTLTLAFALLVIAAAIPTPLCAQKGPMVFSAMVIASEGTPGSSGRINIRIDAFTTSQERTMLVELFKQSSSDAVSLLQTMNQGFVTIEGKPGRKILAAFARDNQNTRDLILIGDHMASDLEKWKGTVPKGFPLAVVHIRFDADGNPLSGEIFPAVKLSVTPDNYLDVETGGTNQVTIVSINRLQ